MRTTRERVEKESGNDFELQSLPTANVKARFVNIRANRMVQLLFVSFSELMGFALEVLQSR